MADVHQRGLNREYTLFKQGYLNYIQGNEMP